MTDPLRPFTQAIRSLWPARTGATANAGSAPSSSAEARNTADAPRAGSSQVADTLKSRLRARIGGLDGSDLNKMRDRFVETVLLWEFGEEIAPDPQFAEVVARVSEQLAAHPTVGKRLHELLLQIASDRD
jgi:hypothetical protein